MPQETCEVKLKRGENVDRALRRLKKALDKEGILKTMRSNRFYEKPRVKKGVLQIQDVLDDKIDLIIKLPSWEFFSNWIFI